MARNSSGSDSDFGGVGDSTRMSKASIGASVQAALAICATCDHTRGDHGEDKACSSGWKDNQGVIVRPCECQEYWPIRRQTEERYTVSKWTMKTTGQFPIAHRRRIESELWDKLTAGAKVRLQAVYEVGPRGFRPVRVKGVVSSVEEVRPLSLIGFVLVDEETGEEIEGWEL